MRPEGPAHRMESESLSAAPSALIWANGPQSRPYGRAYALPALRAFGAGAPANIQLTIRREAPAAGSPARERGVDLQSAPSAGGAAQGPSGTLHQATRYAGGS